MNLETEGRINFLVNFIERLVTQSKLSLIFTKTPNVHIKQPISKITYIEACKNADGNPRFYTTKVNSWKLNFWKQPIVVEDEIKVSIVLTKTYPVKAKKFIIAIFCFPVLLKRYLHYCKILIIFFFILIYIFFEGFQSMYKTNNH